LPAVLTCLPGPGPDEDSLHKSRTELADLRMMFLKGPGIERHADSIRRWDWIALLLHYVINPARRLTTNNRRSERQSAWSPWAPVPYRKIFLRAWHGPATGAGGIPRSDFAAASVAALG